MASKSTFRLAVLSSRYSVPSKFYQSNYLNSCSLSKRSFFSSPPPSSSSDLVNRLERLSTSIISSNWADYLNLCLNLSLWESELDILEQKAKKYKSDEEIQKHLSEVQSTMDCLIRASDVRDDLNEVMEHSSRHAGIAGTGFNAAEHVDNLKAHAEAAGHVYDQLLKEYPELSPKIEESVGQGLALMRQKCRYQFSSQHQYFF